MKSQGVRALGELDKDGVVQSLVGVVLGKFDAQPSRLNAHCRVALGVESERVAPVPRWRFDIPSARARMIKRMLSEVAQQFAERFRAVEAMAFGKPLYLLEALLATERETLCYGHITREVTAYLSYCAGRTSFP